MSSVILTGDTSGTVTIAAPTIAGLNTMTLLAATGTLSPKVLSTTVATTSGTSIDFTGIPSWVSRVTVIFSGVSIDNTASIIIQFGSGSIKTSGYVGIAWSGGSGNTGQSLTSGFPVDNGNTPAASRVAYGLYMFNNLGSNVWSGSGNVSQITNQATTCAGGVTLSGALDRIRITTDGAGVFDAGAVNILYE